MPVLRLVGTRAPTFGVQNFTASPGAAAEAMIASCLEEAAAKSRLSIEALAGCRHKFKKSLKTAQAQQAIKQALDLSTSVTKLTDSHASLQKTWTHNICITQQLLLEPGVQKCFVFQH